MLIPTAQQKNVMAQYDGGSPPLREVARRLGLSPGRISQLLVRCAAMGWLAHPERGQWALSAEGRTAVRRWQAAHDAARAVRR
jgi:Mn-dependent DtxR family transcriptional regulator